MTLAEFFEAIAQISGLLFVVSSMLAMGLNLTMPQILQPLKNVRLVLLALLAKFRTRAAAGLRHHSACSARTVASGRPGRAGHRGGGAFLPKLAQGAKGNVAFGVGLMVLLMVVTIIYVPLVLPLILQGVSVNPWDIAKSLIVLMLVPLAIGLLFNSHSPDTAAHWQPVMAKISSLTLLILLVVGLGLNISNIIDLIGTNGLLALLLFIVGSLLIGMLLGGRDAGNRSVMGLGTAQRNVSAALVVTAQNFSGTNTLPFVLVGAILLLLILLPTAKRMGGRAQTAAIPEAK